MANKTTVALNEAAIAEALAHHYAEMGDIEMASICAAKMQHRLDDAEETIEKESTELSDDPMNFHIEIE